MNQNYLDKLVLDMALKNFTKSTSTDYLRFVRRFLSFTGKDAMEITYSDIRKFIFHMKEQELKKASTINCYTAAIRFFFEYTLGYVWDSKKIPKMKRDRLLPTVLTREEAVQLIDSIHNYKHKAIAMIYVTKSKNRQDRYALLSDRNLEILTEYWFRYNKPKGWLFPSTVRDEPLTTEAVEQHPKKQVRLLGLPDTVTPLFRNPN